MGAVAFSPDGTRIASTGFKTVWSMGRSDGADAAHPQGAQKPRCPAWRSAPTANASSPGAGTDTAEGVGRRDGPAESSPSRDTRARVTSVAFSPDGKRIATGSEDRTVKVWDAETGQETAHPQGHTGDQRGVQPRRQAHRLRQRGRRRSKVWDARTGQRTAHPQGTHGRGHCSVAFSPDGRRIASGSWDSTVKVWDASTGQEVCSPSRGTRAAVTSVAFSPDGTRIVSGSEDKTVKVWDAAHGPGDCSPSRGTRARCTQRGVQPRRHAHRLGQPGQDGEGVGRQRRARRCLTLKGHTSGVSAAWRSAPTADASPRAAADKTVKVWDAATGQEVLTLKGHTQLGHQRGVQPRRHTHRLGQRGQDGEGVGRRRRARRLLTLKGHTSERAAAWRSAPTASASSPAARTRR